jgi:Spy/CpxP family protein refolding chaperone
MPLSAVAQGGVLHEDALERHLYSPETIMRLSHVLELTEEQREEVKQTVIQLQAIVVDLQWRLQETSHELLQLVEQQHVDIDASLQHLDRVLAIEHEIKRHHVRFLLELKNSLTPDQQQKLEEHIDAEMHRPMQGMLMEHGMSGHLEGELRHLEGELESRLHGELMRLREGARLHREERIR